jgi:hypothetical protein
MSRGLGRLQREILETLEEAKQADVLYGGMVSVWGTAKHDPNRAAWHGLVFELESGMYNLRKSRAYLAKKHELNRLLWEWNRFQSSFWRAARKLIERGLLVKTDCRRGEIWGPTKFIVKRSE